MPEGKYPFSACRHASTLSLGSPCPRGTTIRHHPRTGWLCDMEAYLSVQAAPSGSRPGVHAASARGCPEDARLPLGGAESTGLVDGQAVQCDPLFHSCNYILSVTLLVFNCFRSSTFIFRGSSSSSSSGPSTFPLPSMPAKARHRTYTEKSPPPVPLSASVYTRSFEPCRCNCR